MMIKIFVISDPCWKEAKKHTMIKKPIRIKVGAYEQQKTIPNDKKFYFIPQSHNEEIIEQLLKDEAKECKVLLVAHKGSISKEKIPQLPIIEFHHGDEISQKIKKYLDNLNNKEMQEEVYNYFKKIYFAFHRTNILNAFLPLHLSLQAFFGISRDENGNWVRIGEKKKYLEKFKINCNDLQKLGKEATDIDNEFKKHFPNTDAFLLVEEAEWDFYASMFNKVMPNCEGMRNDCTANCDEEKEEYTKDRKISVLLEYFIENTKLEENEKKQLKSLKAAFEQKYGEEANAPEANEEWFQINDQPVSYAEFVKTLREVCAILANTDGNCKRNDGEIFIYKGKCLKERDDILKNIWNIDNETKLNETRHCKLQKSDLYDRLKEQLIAWGTQNNFKKLKIVIQGIEELAKCLGICERWEI